MPDLSKALLVKSAGSGAAFFMSGRLPLPPRARIVQTFQNAFEAGRAFARERGYGAHVWAIFQDAENAAFERGKRYEASYKGRRKNGR